MSDPQLPPPVGPVPPAPQPGYGVPPVPAAPPEIAPSFPPPATGGYAAPGYPTPPASPTAPAYHQAPPGAYQVPVGGYSAPAGAYAPPAAPEPKSPLFGVLALVFSLVAAVVTPIVVGFAGYEIGRRVPQYSQYSTGDVESLSFLAPARDQVLWAELSFWTGTLLGLAAIVVGIIAIVKRRGRGQGIGALIIAVLAPIAFFIVLVIALGIGATTGISTLYGS